MPHQTPPVCRSSGAPSPEGLQAARSSDSTIRPKPSESRLGTFQRRLEWRVTHSLAFDETGNSALGYDSCSLLGGYVSRGLASTGSVSAAGRQPADGQPLPVHSSHGSLPVPFFPAIPHEPCLLPEAGPLFDARTISRCVLPMAAKLRKDAGKPALACNPPRWYRGETDSED